MADVNSVSGAGSAGNTSSTKQTKSTNSMDEAQDRFLRLLTTQMRNQDPLNPLDNAQVTTQMAQINTVTGITKLNESIAALSKSMVAGQAMQAASVIGRQALVQGNQLALTGSGGASAGIDFAKDVDNVAVAIVDANGNQVAKQELGEQKAGMMRLDWDGKDDNGNALPAGTYHYAVQAKAADGSLVDATKYAFGKVGSVLLGDDGVKLDIGSLGTVAMTDVKQIV